MMLSHTLQVDIGHGYKPPGYYVQHSYGLFPGPWPQDSPQLTHVCRHFELLGMFIAKCIQDGRRVDLPLSRPFYKLLCTPGSHQTHVDHTPNDHEEETTSPCNESDNQTSNISEGQAGPTGRSNRPLTPHPLNSDMEGGKVAEFLFCDEIPKDSCKNEVLTLELGETEESGSDTQRQSGSDTSWVTGILDRGDLEEINPYRAKFLSQLDAALVERVKIEGRQELSPREQEVLLSAVRVGGGENLPGALFEELW